MIFESFDRFLSIGCPCHYHACILQHHRSKLGIQIIIFCHKNIDTRQITMHRFFLLLMNILLCQLQRNLHCESSSNALFAFHVNFATHHVNIFLCNGHSKSGTFILCSGTAIIFLRKWFK